MPTKDDLLKERIEARDLLRRNSIPTALRRLEGGGFELTLNPAWKRPLIRTVLLGVENHEQVRRLVMTFAKVDGGWINELSLLPQIEELNITGSNVDEEALAVIATLEHLRVLHMSHCNIGSAALKTMQNHTIEVLSLWGNRRINNEALPHLRGFSRLKQLCLSETSVAETTARAVFAGWDIELEF